MLQGRALVPGTASGSALVLAEPLSLWGGLNPKTGEIIDQRHPNAGDSVIDRVLVLPAGRGSSSASSILLEAVRLQTAPAAIVLAESDGILALGAAVAAEMYGRWPPVLQLPEGSYRQIRSGDWLTVSPEGRIEVTSAN